MLASDFPQAMLFDPSGALIRVYPVAFYGSAMALDPSGRAFRALVAFAPPQMVGLAQIDLATGTRLELRPNHHAPVRAGWAQVLDLEVRSGWQAAVNGATHIPALAPVVGIPLLAALAVLALLRIG